jgi:hypothetical protein
MEENKELKLIPISFISNGILIKGEIDEDTIRLIDIIIKSQDKIFITLYNVIIDNIREIYNYDTFNLLNTNINGYSINYGN